MKNTVMSIAPDMVALIWKIIRFSKGGFSPDERKELAADLLELVDDLLDGVIPTLRDSK